jgi:hypothetical protein
MREDGKPVEGETVDMHMPSGSVTPAEPSEGEEADANHSLNWSNGLGARLERVSGAAVYW